jgi:hypothetical protein
MEQERKEGTIRRWIAEKGWGIINSYNKGGDLQKYFCHVKEFVATSATPEMGSRVSFVPGPARTANELPTAQQAEVITLSGQSTDEGGV